MLKVRDIMTAGPITVFEPDAGADMADDTVSDRAFFTDMLSDADTEVDVRMARMLDPDLDVLDEYTVADAMTTAMKTIRPDVEATAAARRALIFVLPSSNTQNA